MTILGRIFFALKNSTFWDFLRQLKGHHFRAFISLSTLKPLRGHAARARAACGRPWWPAATPENPREDQHVHVTTDGLSLTTLTSTATVGTDDTRTGINWGSVLSLGSQSELDPLNNNSFNTEHGGWTAATAAASNATTIQSPGGSSSLTELDHTFDDISWKLAGSDDVLGTLKAFPTGQADTEPSSCGDTAAFVR